MKLITFCSNCKKEFDINSNAISRGELADEIGDYFDIQCPECLKNNKKHVNEVRATVSVKKQFMATIFGIGLAMFLILLLLGRGFVSSIIFFIPLAIYWYAKQSQEKSADLFNRYRINKS